MSASDYAQGLHAAAEWVLANADALDADGVDLLDSLMVPVVSPQAWTALTASLDGDDATVPASGYVAVARWFGPAVEVRLGTTAEIDAAARGIGEAA